MIMEKLNQFVNTLNVPIWGVGMLVLILVSGIYFTIRLHGFQFVRFKDMWSRILDKCDSNAGVSNFASFCTIMAMRVGTGNVAGVAVAIYAGGPEALFWMIIAGIFNSAVCFTECTLSTLYKTKIDGQYRSGGAYCPIADWDGNITEPCLPQSLPSDAPASCQPQPHTQSVTDLKMHSTSLCGSVHSLSPSSWPSSY